MGPLLGSRDELLRLVEAAFPDTGIHVRGNEIAIDGAAAEQVGRLFEELVLLLQQGHPLEPAVLGRTIEMVRADERPSEVLTTEVLRSGRGRSVRPKSSGQKRYVDAIRENVITFGIGPAGTGKSWLAVAMAVQALQAKEVERIILTRPAVEAGERLGFLPRDLLSQGGPDLPPLFHGRPTPVLGVYPQGRKTVYRLATQDGAATLASGDHLWFVTTRDDRRHGKP